MSGHKRRCRLRFRTFGREFCEELVDVDEEVIVCVVCLSFFRQDDEERVSGSVRDENGRTLARICKVSRNQNV